MYACIFMDKLETDFLNMQEYLLLVWYWYIDDIFFIWAHGEEKKFFLDDLNKYHPNINFIHKSNKEYINFLDLTVSLLDNKVSTDSYIKEAPVSYLFLLTSWSHQKVYSLQPDIKCVGEIVELTKETMLQKNISLNLSGIQT